MKWLKNLLGITALEEQIADQSKQIKWLSNRVETKFTDYDKLTTRDFDFGYRGNCTVVLTGVFRGRGYVQFYDMPFEQFQNEVERYRDMKKHNLMRNIDGPPNFYGAFNIK